MKIILCLLLFFCAVSNLETAQPSTIVIFGATGDLTARKVMPALYHLAESGNLSENTVIVGVGRRDYDNASFRALMREATKASETSWKDFEKRLFYQRVHFESDQGYEDLRSLLRDLDRDFLTQGNRLFYLATQPSAFATIIEKLHAHDLIYDPKVKTSLGKWSRVIIEKPFGHDLESAVELQGQIAKYLDESQIYRIDHYLGKAGVQNLYTLRFENVFFEPIWNNRYIDHVQITMSEQIGIGSRSKFWEETGLLRDIFQNHLLQLLSLLAMERPQSLQEIHKEKIKLLKAIRPFSDLEHTVVRGQYGAGEIDNHAVPGYREEKGIPAHSLVETFVAAKIFIDNERWKGVPFYVRSGKRLASQITEIVVTFKENQNTLVIRIQPDPGVFLKMLPNNDSVVMGYPIDSSPEAYEKLIFDCIRGDNGSFVTAEEQIEAWRLLAPIIDHWKTSSLKEVPHYEAGGWGPKEADDLLERDGRMWLISPSQ